MNNTGTDELVHLRSLYRKNKDWVKCDEIREVLDLRHSFVFDTNEGQVVYHELSGTREELINKLNRDKRADRMFDAWLFSIKSN